MVRGLRKKDKKTFANDFKTIYHASDEESGYANILKVKEKWDSKYPNAMKALYLATYEVTKKWTMPLRNWGKVYCELPIMYEGRMPE